MRTQTVVRSLPDLAHGGELVEALLLRTRADGQTELVLRIHGRWGLGTPVHVTTEDLPE